MCYTTLWAGLRAVDGCRGRSAAGLQCCCPADSATCAVAKSRDSTLVLTRPGPALWLLHAGMLPWRSAIVALLVHATRRRCVSTGGGDFKAAARAVAGCVGRGVKGLLLLE